MYGVVSLLDDEHETLVEGLWAEFQQKFGVHGVSMTPIPHFSYHVAEHYDMERVAGIVRQIARDTPPFRVKTSGLGIFTGPDRVLYVIVDHNPVLAALHRRIWEAMDGLTDTANPYYHPDNWHPHITITHKDVDDELLPEIVELIDQRDFNWDIGVDNLAVLGAEPGEIHSVTHRFPLGG